MHMHMHMCMCVCCIRLKLYTFSNKYNGPLYGVTLTAQTSSTCLYRKYYIKYGFT